MYNVLESGSAKWIKTNGGSLHYTSNRSEATVFDDRLLKDADYYYADFSIYKRTMRVVPVGDHGGLFNLRVREYLGALVS